MTDRGAGPSRVAPLIAALARQRGALVARDALALQACSEEVVQRLAELHAQGPLNTAEEVQTVAAANVALRANAAVLSQATAINTRALAALFEPPPTYSAAGAANASRSPRRLDTA